MDARLRIVSGPFAGQTVQIPRGKLLIGRAEDCDVRPDDEFVSGYHCVLLLDDYTIRIRDLDSRNGTFVNGRHIGTSPVILLDGDVISIGEMTILIDLSPLRRESPPAGASSPDLPTAIQGTSVFEGDTVQAEVPDVALPPPPSRLSPLLPRADSTPVNPEVNPDILPPSEVKQASDQTDSRP